MPTEFVQIVSPDGLNTARVARVSFDRVWSPRGWTLKVSEEDQAAETEQDADTAAEQDASGTTDADTPGGGMTDAQVAGATAAPQLGRGRGA